MITRRDTTMMLLAATAASSLPGRARAASAEEWKRALEQALDAASVTGKGTRLSLVDFGFGKKSGWSGFSTVVRMDWPPGMRTRRFDLTAEGEQQTFKRLIGMILAEFRQANPEGVREVAFR